MTHTPDTSATHSVAQFAAAEPRQRILIIGDDQLTQQPNIDYLEREGYEVRAIPSEEASLAGMARFVPDVIVVNIQQPEDDWLRAVRSVREMSTAPILILSPRGDATDRLVGVDVHLSKPLQRSELVQRIETLMRGHGIAENPPTGEAAGLQLEGDLGFDDLVIRPLSCAPGVHAPATARLGLALRLLRRLADRDGAHVAAAQEGGAGPHEPTAPAHRLGRWLQVHALGGVGREAQLAATHADRWGSGE